MPRNIAGIVGFLVTTGCTLAAGPDIDVQAHLDKQRHLAGEPVYLIWEYTNDGPEAKPFEVDDLYCMEPRIETTSLLPAMPPVCPDRGEALSCESELRQLGPGEKYVARYLLNGRFDLNQPGTYALTVFDPRMGGPVSQQRTFSLVLDRGSERDLRNAYAPYLEALNSPGATAATSRVLSGAGMPFTESALLRVAIDPRRDSYTQSIAIDGLARLRTPLACARLAELAEHPELHRQNRAIEYLGQCGDPSYMLLLFTLAEPRGLARPAPRGLALAAAAEAGGPASVDRLAHMLPEAEPDDVFLALGRTGSKQAAQVIIDALPSLAAESTRYVALLSLMTLTHRESKQSNYEAKVGEWRAWWKSEGTKTIYQPRDCRGGITAIR